MATTQEQMKFINQKAMEQSISLQRGNVTLTIGHVGETTMPLYESGGDFYLSQPAQNSWGCLAWPISEKDVLNIYRGLQENPYRRSFSLSQERG